MTDKKLVYQLTDTDGAYRDEVAKEMVTAFLEAHGIDPNLFPLGNPISVYRLADGSFQLATWRTTEGWPICETCPSCIKQERVEMPLAAPVPAVPGASLLSLDGERPDVAEPEDAVVAAESAYRAVLEAHARTTADSSRLIQRRADELARARSIGVSA